MHRLWRPGRPLLPENTAASKVWRLGHLLYGRTFQPQKDTHDAAPVQGQVEAIIHFSSGYSSCRPSGSNLCRPHHATPYAGPSGGKPTVQAGAPRRRSLATRLLHPPKVTSDPYGAVALPLYQTATFEQVSAVQCGPYDYTRSGNPTRDQLAAHIADLEVSFAALLCTS